MDEIVYTTFDKSGWGAGPWADEPDKIQYEDDATGLPCLINRVEFSGALCGYVGVPSGHPWYGKSFLDLQGVAAHRGLSYSDHCQEGPEDIAICHIPQDGESDEVWWLGFHCHNIPYDVGPAFDAFHREIGLDITFRTDVESVYRTVDYVRAECARLARQIAAHA